MKKTLSLLITIVMLLQTSVMAVPMGVETVEETEKAHEIVEEAELFDIAPVKNKKGSDFTSNSYIANKLDSLFNLLPYSSYPYFTTYGNKTCGNSSCDQCNAQNVVKKHPNLKNLGLDTSKFSGWSCFGFAQFAYYYIFGRQAGEYGTESQREISTLKRVVKVQNYNLDTCKNALSQAKAGDIIQGHGSGGVHSMIFLGCDSTYVWVLQNNYFGSTYGRNYVSVSGINYTTFVSNYGTAMSVYRCPDEYYPGGAPVQTVTVTFDANGGTAYSTSRVVTVGYAYGATNSLPLAGRNGYTFDGWYTSATGGTKITNDTIVTKSSNHTLYAHWTPAQVKVSFDAKGGSVSQNSKTVAYGSEYGTLPTPTRTGYSFLGWLFPLNDGTYKKIYNDTIMYESYDHTLIANWNHKNFKLTFDANGGRMPDGSSSYKKTVFYDDEYKGFPVVTRDGYTFEGWFTSISGGKKVVEGDVIKILDDQTLYARWTPNMYVNGKKGELLLTEGEHQITYDMFANEYISEAILYIYKDGEMYYNGSVKNTNTYTRHYPVGNYEGYINLTYSYGYSIDTNTVKWNVDYPLVPTQEGIFASATEIGAGETVDFVFGVYGAREFKYRISNGTDIIASADLTEADRFSYTFENPGTYQIMSSAHNTVNSIDLTTLTITVTVKKTYTVTYNPNGGSGAPASQTKTHDVALTLSSTEPTRDDYTFLGWSTSANGSVEYAAGATYTANSAVTLYAVWRLDTIFVSGVSLNKTTATLTEGETLTLTATVNPSNATNKAVTWKSSNTSVATVANGVVTAVGEGNAIITVTTVDGGKSASCTITVESEEPDEPVEYKATMTLSDDTGKPGDEVKVVVSLKTEESINTIGFAGLEYDEDVLTFEKCTVNADFKEMCAITKFDKNQMTFVAALKTEDDDGEPILPPAKFDSEVCTLTFRINENAEEGSTFVRAVANVKLNSTVVETEVVPATVCVTSQILGDLNLDETVDMNDAILLLQHSMFSELYPIDYSGSVDFTKDGNVDMNDAILLLQHSMFPELYPIN